MVDFKRFILQVSSPAMCTKTHIAGFFVKKIRNSQIFKEIMLKVCYTISDKV